MRRRGVRFGVLGAISLVVAAVLGEAASVRPRVGAVPPPNPAALAAVGGCEELREYLVDAMVEQLVHLWLHPWRILDGGATTGGEGGEGLDFTTTNNQEAGVDELDIVKTDGSYLYVAMDQTLRVLRSWPPESTALVGEAPLAGWASGLFLRRSLVAVLSSSGGMILGGPFWLPTTRLDLFDVSRPERPRLVRSLEVDGTLVGARRVDGHLYVVLYRWLAIPEKAWQLLWGGNIGLPQVSSDWTAEERAAAAALARQILRPYVVEIVAAMTLDEVLPRLRDSAQGSGTGLATAFPCSAVYRPAAVGSYGMLAVLHLDLDAAAGGGVVDGVGLLADGWTVYASSHNLYVANGQRWWWWLDEGEASVAIHKFALGGGPPVRYLASGEVPGFLLNQFAMSEHNGLLRVASTEFNVFNPDPAERRGSSVSVLRDDGQGQLRTVGQVRGIAPGERIFAARFLADTGFLVTFEQVDPLFTLDLSDPTRPRLVGELEMPGFSAYLHPLGDRHLLAVGRGEDSRGQLTEMAVNVFDVADLAAPKLVFQYLLPRGDGEWSWSEALWDHHAFTFHNGVLSVPLALASRDRYTSALAVLEVDLAHGIRLLGQVDHDDLAGPNAWPWMRRSVYVEQYLYSLSTVGLKTSRLKAPEQVLAAVRFREAVQGPPQVGGASR